MARRKQNKISGQFSARLVEMMESPAFRVLSLSAHRVLFRIEAEHAHHAGTENGRLPVTYEQFEQYGVHRQAIAPAIRELVALGFITYDKGRHGNGIYHVPNKFTLTYRNVDGERGDGSHEWRRVKSMEDAEAIAIKARDVKKRKAKSISPVVENVSSQWWKTPLETKSPVVENTPTVPVVENTPTSISRDIVRG